MKHNGKISYQTIAAAAQGNDEAIAEIVPAL